MCSDPNDVGVRRSRKRNVWFPGVSTGRPELSRASELARASRRVPYPELHRSPGLLRVLEDGRYDHPELQPSTIGPFGVLLSKPATIMTPAVLDDLAERAAECGYLVVTARMVTASELVAEGTMRRHYAAHWDIAREGRLQPDERLRLLDIYDRPGFDDRFGVAAVDVPVVPVLEYLARSGISLDAINDWSEASADAHGLNSGTFDGPNEVGDLTYVNLFGPSDGSSPPVFLLNPHLPSVTSWFERTPTPILAALLGSAGDDALPWARMRAEFCGGPDPSTAPPGSLRRDMWDGVWPMRYVDGIDVGRSHNGVHLSNGPVEAVREAWIWFGIAPEETEAGRTLVAACDGDADLLDAPYLRCEGRTRVLVDVTRDLSATEAARVLAGGQASTLGAQAMTEATARRVDLAHRIARELAANAEVTAVLAGGSVAANRASDDSDLDLIAITTSTERSLSVERVERAGVVVEIDWLRLDTALEIAAGGELRDVRELRRSARLGLALAVYDPEGVARDLARRARAARPDLASAGERLLEAYDAFVALADAPTREPAASWEAMRALYDVISFLLLLASPLRYQKPKWVIADLDDTGNGDVAAALLHAYGIDGGEAGAAEAVESAARLVEVTAAARGLPPAETIRELGLVASFPEYSYLCHCVDDARSLLADRSFAAAAYAAKFSARMAAALREGSDGGEPEPEIEALALALFADDRNRGAVGGQALERCLEHLERCRARLLPAGGE
jgi:predicted nucleotidyltransferase